MLRITSNHLAPLKTRDIPTLTKPHLPLNNNGSNPPLSARFFLSHCKQRRYFNSLLCSEPFYRLLHNLLNRGDDERAKATWEWAVEELTARAQACKVSVTSSSNETPLKVVCSSASVAASCPRISLARNSPTKLPSPTHLIFNRLIGLWAAISAKSHPNRKNYLRAPVREGFWAAQGHLRRVGGF